jgi:hypothetical protein
MENHESRFKATPRDKYLGAKSHIINQVNTQQFLNDDISIERSDRISDIISPDDPYYEPNRISKLAEVKKLRLDCLGPSSTLDNFIYGLALFTADPELRDQFDKYLAWLSKYCRYCDDLTQLSN